MNEIYKLNEKGMKLILKKNKNRVGIVTLYDDNYGTCLQAFALCNKISEMGYEPEIIRYIRGNVNVRNESWMKKVVGKLRSMPPKLILTYLLSYKWIRERKASFSNFRERYLKFGEETNYRD